MSLSLLGQMPYLGLELDVSQFRLRNYLLASICLLAGYLVQAQPGKPSVRHFVKTDKIPTAAMLDGHAVDMAADSAFKIGVDGLLVSGSLQENAHCRDGKAQWMQYGKARFRQDTLLISLFRTDRRYVYELEIKVWRGEFSTEYRISSRDGGSHVAIVSTDQVLVLEKIDLDRGQQVTGFINFGGTRWEEKPSSKHWESMMDWVESTYVVHGPFKITIQ